MGSSTSATNQIVMYKTGSTTRYEHGNHHHYTAKVKLKIAKHAYDNDNKSPVIKFTQEFRHRVSESSARNTCMKQPYME